MLISADDLEVRTINENELNDVLTVYALSEDFLALGPEPKASVSMIKQDLETSRKESGCFCGIYQSNRKIVGVVDFVPNGFKGEEGVGFFSLLMIAPTYRNQGLGAKIVKLIEGNMIKDFSLKTIRSAVQTNNPGALRFWQRNCYSVIGNPELQPDGTTVYYLEKDLK